jgi:hypothetical protein
MARDENFTSVRGRHGVEQGDEEQNVPIVIVKQPEIILTPEEREKMELMINRSQSSRLPRVVLD